MGKKIKEKQTNHLLHLVQKHKKYSGHIYLTVAGQIISALITGSFGLLFKYLIDSMNNGDMDGFVKITWIFSMLLFVNIPLLGLRTFSIGKYSSLLVCDIQNEIADQATKMKTSEIDAMHSGDFVSKANNDLGQLRTFFSTHLQVSIRLIVGGIVSFGLMLYLNWLLTLITFIATPIFLYVTVLIGKPLKDLTVKRNEKLGEVNKLTQDALGGYVEIRTYNLHEKLSKKAKEAVADSVELLIKMAKTETLSNGFGFLCRIIPVIILMAVGSIFALNGVGNITIGTIIALSNLSNTPLNLLFMLSNIVNNYKKAQGSAQGVMKIFDFKNERIDGTTTFPIKENTPIISFANVSFKYKKEEQNALVLSNLSFSINKGEKIAFVGESGCGKSTILKLIAGFYSPDNGQLLINGVSIDLINLVSYRKSLSIVDQDTYLYPGTLFENIACGILTEYEKVPFKLVEQAARTANIDSFIKTLPNEYDTFALERGVRLSGGQKQRISMARACIRNASIILLDEPTSALDVENEKIVQSELNHLIAGKTSIIVAHRLTTIKDADRIFVIDQGNIVESGTHTSLLEKQGKYYQLLSKQLLKEREA